MQQINFVKMCPIPFRCFANISKGDSCTAMEDDINQVFDEQVEMLRMLTLQNRKARGNDRYAVTVFFQRVVTSWGRRDRRYGDRPGSSKCFHVIGR